MCARHHRKHITFRNIMYNIPKPIILFSLKKIVMMNIGILCDSNLSDFLNDDYLSDFYIKIIYRNNKNYQNLQVRVISR